MTIEASNLLQTLSGASNIGASSLGSTVGSGEPNAFTQTFMQQLGQFQSSLEHLGTLNPQTSMASSSKPNLPAEAQTALQNIAALFGNRLPLASQADTSIDLDQALGTLNDVMQRLQALGGVADEAVDISSLPVNTLKAERAPEFSADVDAETSVGSAIQTVVATSGQEADVPHAQSPMMPVDYVSQRLQVDDIELTAHSDVLLQSDTVLETPWSTPASSSNMESLASDQRGVVVTHAKSPIVSPDDTEELSRDDVLQAEMLQAAVDPAIQENAFVSTPATPEPRRAKANSKTTHADDENVSIALPELAMPGIETSNNFESNPASSMIPTAKTADASPFAVSEGIEARRASMAESRSMPATPWLQVEPKTSDGIAHALGHDFQALFMQDSATTSNTLRDPAMFATTEGGVSTGMMEDASQMPGLSTDRPAFNFANDVQRLNQAMPSQAASSAMTMNKTLADPAWSAELGDKLIWMHNQSVPSVELRLNPEHLGQVLIKIDVQQDQAMVAFSAEHQSVKEAIEASIPKLREMLGGQQLQLTDVNVSQHQSEQRQAREFYQASGEQGRNRQPQPDGSAEQTLVDHGHDIMEEIEAGRAIASSGLLSLFA